MLTTQEEITMARPERIGQSLASIEALIHYLEEGEKPASYGGVRQSVADQQRKGKYQGHKMTIALVWSKERARKQR